MKVEIPDDLVDDVASAIEHQATHYHNDKGHDPEDVAKLAADADRLDELSARILEQRDSLEERLQLAEADAAKWRDRAETLLRVVGGDLAGRLVRLLEERGHGALDRELQELLDQLRPVVCG